MPFLFRLLAAAWLLAMSITPAQALTSSLELCNQTSNQVYLALGFPLDANGSQMAARGWYSLDAGSCKTVYSGPLTARYFYIFGLDGASRNWVGDSGDPSFCMSENAFDNLLSTDSCSEADQFRGRFLTIDSGGSTVKGKHTFLLTAKKTGAIALGKADASGVTATITPGSDEIGRDASVWMAAKLGDTLFVRHNMSEASWAPYLGGKLPTALLLNNLSTPATVSVIESDISSFAGLEFYVAYGVTEADIQKPGHLEKIHTVPALPVAPANPLTGLTITCSAKIGDVTNGVAGKGICGATANYKNGTSKDLADSSALTWSTSPSGYLAVSADAGGGPLFTLNSLRTITDYLNVTVTANYSEGGVSKTASKVVSVQHNMIPNCLGLSCACVAPNIVTGNYCVAPKPTCVAPQILQNNVCVDPPTCVAPQVLQNGACVTPAPTCTAPEVLEGGVCVTPPLKCTAPQVPDNGVCVTPTVTCSKFMVYHNGTCNYPLEFDPRGFPTTGFRNMCNGWVYVPNGPCVKEEAYIRSAESCGMTGSNTIYASSLLVYYRCLAANSSGSFKQQYETQLYDYQKTYLVCATGYHVENKHCVKDGPVCTIQNGACVYPTPNCTPPQVAQNGVCVEPATVTTGSTSGTSGTGNSSSNVVIDSDGCYQSPSWALEVVKTSNSSGEFKVTYRNASTQGIYLSFSNERADGTWDSGADHLGPGKSTTWWTAGGTGRYKASWVGSSKWESDWVCNDGRVTANSLQGP